jgi:hypothetical protein
VQGSCKSDRPEPRPEVTKPISLGRIRYEHWSENGAARVRRLGSEKGATSGSGVMGLAPSTTSFGEDCRRASYRDRVNSTPVESVATVLGWCAFQLNGIELPKRS